METFVYQMKLGPNCDQLLSLLAGRYLPKVLPEQQAATMAMWILMQALIDAERIIPRLYEKARRELVKFTENQTLLLEQSGLLSKADRKAMMQANRDYIPFHRLIENVTGAGGKSSGKGFANAQAGVARFKGSDMEITNPLEAVVKNGMMFRELAERNRVGRLFVQAVDDTQGGGRIGETVLRSIKAVKVSHDEVLQKLQAAGVLPKGAKINKAMLDLGMTVFRAADSVKASDGVFTVHMDGKPVSFQVEDKELLRALTLMDSADAEVFNKFPLLRMMRAATNVLRKGATLAPEFLIRNPFRDQIIAGVYSRHGFIPFWDGFRGTLHMLRQDSTYRDWIKSGGKYSGLYDVEQGDHNAALQAAVHGNRTALEQALYLAKCLGPVMCLKNEKRERGIFPPPSSFFQSISIGLPVRTFFQSRFSPVWTSRNILEYREILEGQGHTLWHTFTPPIS